jgi:hypothetical protein
MSTFRPVGGGIRGGLNRLAAGGMGDVADSTRGRDYGMPATSGRQSTVTGMASSLVWVSGSSSGVGRSSAHTVPWPHTKVIWATAPRSMSDPSNSVWSCGFARISKDEGGRCFDPG